MKREERVAIVRILTDLIKADAIIDSGEMKKYAELKVKYNISKEDEIQSSKISLEDALTIISESSSKFKSGLYTDCAHMTVSDGFCAGSEALLMIAIRRIIAPNANEYAEFISIPQPTFSISAYSVLYIESEYDKVVNEAIANNYRSIYRETQMAGFNFVYIPTIVAHYKHADNALVKQITSFLAPSFSDEGVCKVIEGICSTTTSSFCKDILCNKLGITAFRDTVPSLLIKIGHSEVSDEVYANYLKIEVDENILVAIQKLVDEFCSMLSTDTISISTMEEKNNQFLYHGFYKQLLDIFLLRKSIRSKVFINPYLEDIYFPDIDQKLNKLHRREKALYLLLLIQTDEGGINFNLPKSSKQLSLYNKRLSEIQRKDPAGM